MDRILPHHDGRSHYVTSGAGAGKSAIAQSIAEFCCAESRLLSGCFFARTNTNFTAMTNEL